MTSAPSLSCGAGERSSNDVRKDCRDHVYIAETVTKLTDRDAPLEMLRIAFFQNCIAFANGLIEDRQFRRAHGTLIDAVAKQVAAPRTAEPAKATAPPAEAKDSKSPEKPKPPAEPKSAK